MYKLRIFYKICVNIGRSCEITLHACEVEPNSNQRPVNEFILFKYWIDTGLMNSAWWEVNYMANAPSPLENRLMDRWVVLRDKAEIKDASTNESFKRNCTAYMAVYFT